MRDEFAAAARRQSAGRLAGATALGVVTALIAALTMVSSRDGAPRVLPSSEVAIERAGVVRDLLLTRSAAVRTGDAQRWLSTVDPTAGTFAADQSTLLRTLAALPRASWTYTQAGDGPALSPQRARELGADAFIARVRLTYRLAGADEREVQRDSYLTFARRDGRWRVAGDADAAPGRPVQVDPWDLGEVVIAEGRSSLVLARPGPAGLVATDLAQLADRAVAQVREVWPQPWPRRVVVIVPADVREMARLVDGGSVTGPDGVAPQGDGLAQIAAVTTGQPVDAAGGPTTGNRIVVNPTAFAGLTESGRQVVLTHEATHVATRSLAGSPTPAWLAEGFADYVAYRSSGLDVAAVAGDTLAGVRSGVVPTRLPQQADFDPARGPVAASYSSAWLAAVQIVRVHGERGLVAFYLAVADHPGNDVDAGQGATAAAFRAVLTTSEAEFVAAWRQFLLDVAGQAPALIAEPAP